LDGPAARVSAQFTPDRLGAASTITFALAIDPQPEVQASPVSGIGVSFPTSLGLATSGLGLATCSPGPLEAEGPGVCPPDSQMGSGSATVDVAFGPSIVTENVSLELFAAPSSDGYVHLAILAHGRHPIAGLIVLDAVLLPGELRIAVPPIVSLPGAPYVSLVAMSASLGGPLRYYERVGDRTVAYRPRGIGLPDSCPRGGWKLGASVTFTDGLQSAARTAVPCPGRHG
jgi:hypothetical protein